MEGGRKGERARKERGMSEGEEREGRVEVVHVCVAEGEGRRCKVGRERGERMGQKWSMIR